MNILILGSGIVGANLANKLSEQGKNVFLLDDDNSELKRLSERYDIKTIFEDPLNPTFYSNFKTKIDYFEPLFLEIIDKIVFIWSLSVTVMTKSEVFNLTSSYKDWSNASP